ncbi:MAG TPA: GTPase Era [Longimicrobiaceae bacterium]|jgi:GTP-binding protein Era|nr:GTPase Era [Longimicrobiaceae bacterium]
MESSEEVMEQGGDETRAGYVALIGLPNAGKSSLMNCMVEQKLSIVTPFAQTTRERVLGIDTRDGVQMVFLDTPGLVDPRYLLHKAMMHAAVEVIGEADVLLLLVDAAGDVPVLTDEVMELVRRHSNLVVVSNKSDLATAEKRRRVKAWTTETFGREAMEVSAKTGAGVDALRDEVVRRLPVSPFLYPEDDVSSQSVRFFVSELVRETVFELYEKEIPYSIAARVDEYRESDSPIYIRCTIFVERPTQKAILIGSGGAAIKRLGSAARQKIEAFVDAPVYLDLWVKVLPRWRKDPLSLQRLGFNLPKAEQ